MDPIYFATPEELRKWFQANHHKEKELIVGYYKKGTKVQSIDWPQSVDQALCFGWIDSIRHSIDHNRYCNRFTPRKKGSTWSAINLKRFDELDKMGLVTPAGRKAWEARDPKRQKWYLSERENPTLAPEYEAQLKADLEAWENWSAMPPSYRKAAIYWVMSAKQEATQQRRLAILIECSAVNRRIPPLRRKPDE